MLENARRIGFQPGTIIDVGFAYGAEGLYDGFEDVPCILIDPVAEAEPAMKAFCEAHPGSAYYVAAASRPPGLNPRDRADRSAIDSGQQAIGGDGRG